MQLFRLTSLVLLLLTIGCGGDDVFLRVDLRTDFVPSAEFAQVVVESGERIQRHSPENGEDFLRGVSVANFDIENGSYFLRVALISERGDLIIERNVQVNIAGSTVVTVPLSRSCLGVICPASNPAATECYNGLCVPPECTKNCGESDCQDASECPAIVATCGAVQCREGQCLFETNQGACAVNESCVPGAGCVPIFIPTAVDAGPDTALGDGGGPDIDMSDAGPPCESGIACARPDICEQGVTDCTSGESVCIAAGVSPRETSCRPTEGVCDAAEVCDGVAPTCPPDGALAPGTPCMGDQFCNGQVCSRCEAGTPCTLGVGFECATGTITCDGSGVPSCVMDGLRPSSTECRPGAGPCDATEMCTGMDGACPTDVFITTRSPCRPTVGMCDAEELCDGSGPACPTNRFRAAGSECRAGSTCDPAEQCSGLSPSCPVDSLTPRGTVCGGPDCNSFGPCVTADCVDGLQSRTCQTPECDGLGVCAPTGGSEDSRACPPSNGAACSICGESICDGSPAMICDGTCNAGCCRSDF